MKFAVIRDNGATIGQYFGLLHQYDVLSMENGQLFHERNERQIGLSHFVVNHVKNSLGKICCK